MTKQDIDYDKLHYNYIALKRIHIIANKNNERLNENNEDLKKDILILEEQTIELANALNVKNQMITDSYTRMNEMKDNYNKVIASLQSKLIKLEKEQNG